MAKVQTLKIDKLVIITTRPTKILRELEKMLHKHAGKDWTYDFKVEE